MKGNTKPGIKSPTNTQFKKQKAMPTNSSKNRKTERIPSEADKNINSNKQIQIKKRFKGLEIDLQIIQEYAQNFNLQNKILKKDTNELKSLTSLSPKGQINKQKLFIKNISKVPVREPIKKQNMLLSGSSIEKNTAQIEAIQQNLKKSKHMKTSSLLRKLSLENHEQISGNHGFCHPKQHIFNENNGQFTQRKQCKSMKLTMTFNTLSPKLKKSFELANMADQILTEKQIKNYERQNKSYTLNQFNKQKAKYGSSNKFNSIQFKQFRDKKEANSEYFTEKTKIFQEQQNNISKNGFLIKKGIKHVSSAENLNSNKEENNQSNLNLDNKKDINRNRALKAPTVQSSKKIQTPKDHSFAFKKDLIMFSPSNQSQNSQTEDNTKKQNWFGKKDGHKLKHLYFPKSEYNEFQTLNKVELSIIQQLPRKDIIKNVHLINDLYLPLRNRQKQLEQHQNGDISKRQCLPKIKQKRYSQPPMNDLKSHKTQQLDQTMQQTIIANQRKNKLSDFVRGPQLGRGKFGVVNLVMHRKTGFLFALKTINKKVLKQCNVEQQLIQQIKIQFYMDHANLVKLYGIFNDRQNIYLILEFCTTGQLYKILQKKKTFKESDTKFITREICEGLTQLHKHKIIHRDLKPQNIVVSFGMSKICDFGWSVHNKENDLRSTLCGTPLYFSPQLLAQQQYNQKVDLWAIGIMTYEMLTGETPFKIKSTQQLSKIINTQIEYPDKMSTEAKQFLKLLLNKKSHQRVQCSELLKHKFLNVNEYSDVRTNSTITKLISRK